MKIEMLKGVSYALCVVDWLGMEWLRWLLKLRCVIFELHINFNERNDIEVFNYVNFMGDFDDDVIAISVLAWEVQREVGVHCELMQLITESFDLDKCGGEDGYVWVLI
ncbi:predicted protein [Histoplasma mississippiense (nom. inval.)]|uniref:predicted protein n=1 Tax=Ajellomyces capsulatus (strain NAm1 / WU24) TaxID=2059318 RepID=UPI000157B6C5|nr:predicted protein [Histoplasma mississippiense (nom. inval.)]EDN02472.1 predicted protein [Histoplasma mississippiense (nom. inval.)]